METFDINFGMTMGDWLSSVNVISGGTIFSVISGVFFVLMFFYVYMFTRDLGKATAVASFVCMVYSILFVAIGVMGSHLLILYSVGIIGGILLMGSGGRSGF